MVVTCRAAVALLAICSAGCCCGPCCPPPCYQGCGCPNYMPCRAACYPQFYGMQAYGPQPVYSPQAYYAPQPYSQAPSPMSSGSANLVANSSDPKRVDQNISYQQATDPMGRIQGSEATAANLQNVSND